MREQSVTRAARRWGVIWPATLAGFVAGAAAGFLAAPDVIALPGLLAVSGSALGLLVGLAIVWWRASEPAAGPAPADEPAPTVGPAPADEPAPTVGPAPAVDRPVADEPVGWPLERPQDDLAPGWYVDPGDSGARRYWDGESWTKHLWRDRERPQRRA